MTTSGSESATGAVVNALAEDVGGLVRQELRQAQAELVAKGKQAGKGAMLLGGAGVLGALAAGSSATLFLRCLDRYLPPRLSAFVVCACYGGAAAALGVRGAAMVKEALPMAPEHTAENLRRDVDAAKAAPSAP